MSEETKELKRHFIRDIIEADNEAGTFGGKVVTRFPPEPNGFLHIGHAKAFCLDFGLAEDYNGTYNLRFDDTNPVKEDPRFVEAIKEDIKWLGFDWEDREYHASDYFEQMFQYAIQLIKMNKAYVDSQSLEEIRENRGTIKTPGTDSPYRTRSIEENLDLFERMRDGEFEDGAHVLRAKIDMTSPNMLMRDPIMYRIRHAHHHRTGDKWCIYPMYDYAHCLEDSIEGITHSLCSLEFEAHRPLYDWYLVELGIHHSKQIEFARLNITYTVMSKRKLQQLVELGVVTGWDDPRLPTLSGMRRRGYTPQAIRNFIDRIGVAKALSTVDFALLEHSVREDLNKHANRVMAVLDPVKVIIDNYPEEQSEEMQAINNPEDPDAGTRLVPFSRELYIERADFMENPPKKFFRLAPGREVRLRYAYFVTCTHVDKDADGTITAIHCTYDPQTQGGNAPDGRKVKATMHWVSAAHAFDATVNLYDKLITLENTEEAEEGKTFLDYINPNSLTVREHCKLEPSLADAAPGTLLQFERLGYFCVDSVLSEPGKPVFNRTATLRDEWAKLQKQKKN